MLIELKLNNMSTPNQPSSTSLLIAQGDIGLMLGMVMSAAYMKYNDNTLVFTELVKDSLDLFGGTLVKPRGHITDIIRFEYIEDEAVAFKVIKFVYINTYAQSVTTGSPVGFLRHHNIISEDKALESTKFNDYEFIPMKEFENNPHYDKKQFSCQVYMDEHDNRLFLEKMENTLKEDNKTNPDSPQEFLMV